MRGAVRDGLLSGPESRLDGIDLEALQPWAAALGGRHPQTPNGPASRADDLTRMTRYAQVIAELGRVAGPDRPRTVGVGRWLATWMARDLTGLEGAGPLPGERIEAAHKALFEGGRLRPDAREAAAHWWSRIGGASAAARGVLLHAVEEAMGSVAPDDLEPRFLPLWWIADA